jgi:hypothetical protein
MMAALMTKHNTRGREVRLMAGEISSAASRGQGVLRARRDDALTSCDAKSPESRLFTVTLTFDGNNGGD